MSLAAADIPVGAMGAGICAFSLGIASSSSISELSVPLFPLGPLVSLPLLPAGEIDLDEFDAADAAAAASATTFTAAAAAAASTLAATSMAADNISMAVYSWWEAQLHKLSSPILLLKITSSTWTFYVPVGDNCSRCLRVVKIFYSE